MSLSILYSFTYVTDYNTFVSHRYHRRIGTRRISIYHFVKIRGIGYFFHNTSHFLLAETIWSGELPGETGLTHLNFRSYHLPHPVALRPWENPVADTCRDYDYFPFRGIQSPDDICITVSVYLFGKYFTKSLKLIISHSII